MDKGTQQTQSLRFFDPPGTYRIIVSSPRCISRGTPIRRARSRDLAGSKKRLTNQIGNDILTGVSLCEYHDQAL
jgi:hypothetical protein